MTEPNIGVWVDPPSGWMYGFPKIKLATDTRSLKQWLIDNGYPKRDILWAKDNCRFWGGSYD